MLKLMKYWLFIGSLLKKALFSWQKFLSFVYVYDNVIFGL